MTGSTRNRSSRTAADGGRSWWRVCLDAAVVAVGVVILVWGTVVLTHPTLTCRGVEMGPGDVCHKSSYTSLRTDTVQSYEQRRRAVAQSRPTVIVLGAVVTVFGAGMLTRRLRRPEPPAPRQSPPKQ
ncbi:hypothetical protein [Acidipropionibacterium jensenii]|uniref:hypothetical protein n=1 Tax=Acidipropionibacterium jensenii TaxID=1749 RepID=UPI000F829CD0|nr:hypothetical protein [Acidipropionibacterium jensenii]MDN6480984.1 hypothetical protein [Acidipropionibacterium jensenii]